MNQLAHRTARPQGTFMPRRTALATAVAMLAAPALHAATLPTGESVVSGAATVGRNGANTAMTVNQSTQSAVINWTSFSIGAGDSVQFVQPNTSAVTLNRVTGNTASDIQGSLAANGRVFLVNTNGVLFAAGSQVNVGGLVASTLAISNDDFNAGVASGQFVFTMPADLNTASNVTNSGTIVAADGGTVALLGTATNTGSITANQGTIALGNSSRYRTAADPAVPLITLDVGGDGLTQLTINANSSYGGRVNNAGTLQADGGRVSMTGSRTFDTSAVVSNTGLIRARSLESRGGQIILTSGDGGGVNVAGTLDASSNADGVAGGNIDISGGVLRVVGDGSGVPTAFDTHGQNAANGNTSLVSDASVVLISQSAADLVPTVVTDSYIADASINSALDTGSTVQIRSGGQVNVDDDVAILRSAGNAPATLNIDAARAFFGGLDATGGPVPWSLESTAGPLDFNVTAQSSVVINRASILTNGGNVRLHSVNSSDTALDLNEGTLIDTRIGQSAANASGSVTLIGLGESSGVRMNETSVATSTGGIVIDGRGSAASAGASGVVISANNSVTSGSGDITVTAVGRGDDYGFFSYNSVIASASGRVDIAGSGGESGVTVLADSAPSSIAGGGGVILTGSSRGTAGIVVGPDAVVSSGASLVLRASNSDAAIAPIEIDGPVSAANTINLRPGGLDDDGLRYDATTTAISIGGSGPFVLGNALLNQLGAPNIVVGSNTHSAAIAVQAPVSLPRNLTLQNTGGGIVLNGAVDLGTRNLVLSSAGNITQAAGAGITAHSLLAQSSAGAVVLDSAANNIQPNTLAGSGATGFVYTNATTVGVGTVSGNGFSAASNNPTALSASGIASGGSVQVRALTGNLVLNAGPIAGATVDLIAAGVFDNAAAVPVNASTALRIWAATYVGENRGGVAGANLYNCNYGGPCGVSVPNSGATYIYAVQPTLNVNIADASREYGLANPAFTYATSGLVNGDTAATALGGTPVTSATAGSNVGSYAITGSGLTSLQGYALNVTNGLLSITPATLSYVANATTREYGLANPVLSGTVTGFRNGDTQAGATSGTLAFTSSANAGSGVGSYAITGSGLSAGNYVFVQAPANAGALQITPATLSYIASSITREYGLDNPALAGSVGGFRNGDTQASATTGTLAFTTSATSGSNVGSYAVTGGGLSAANYVFAQATGNASALQITPASLSYVANGVSREYGLANPALSGGVTGFRNGDTQASATSGTLAFDTPATAASNVGSYAVNGSGLEANFGNYVFTQAAGNASALQITPASLSYVANAVTREYGLANPALSGGVTGFRNGDTQSSATSGTLAFSTLANAASGVGSYAVNGSGLSANSGNYVLTQAAGNASALSITPALLTYVANAATREYGLANPAFDGGVTGFRNGDTMASATTGTLSFVSPATAGSNVGNYAITGTGLTAGNYQLVQASSNGSALRIVPATLTYNADPVTRSLGSPNPPQLSGTVDGFRNGDTLASATSGAPVFTTEATASSPVGSYAITGSGVSALNYVLVQAPGNLESLSIAPVPLIPAVAEVINPPETSLYGSNFGPVPAICAASSAELASIGGTDTLARDWSLLRSKPNLSSCVDTQKKSSCSAGF